MVRYEIASVVRELHEDKPHPEPHGHSYIPRWWICLLATFAPWYEVLVKSIGKHFSTKPITDDRFW